MTYCISVLGRQLLFSGAPTPWHPRLRTLGTHFGSQASRIRPLSSHSIDTDRPSSEQNIEVHSGLRSFKGRSGRVYSIDRVLQEKDHPPSYVYMATSANEKFILKTVPPTRFADYENKYKRLSACKYLRVSCDSVPDQSIFVYKYLSDHLLSLALEEVGLPNIKRTLKDALRGIAAMHDQDIVHTDIKPNNIFIQRQGTEIREVRLADLEDSAYVPVGSAIVGRQMGNWMWRSPEAHAEGPVNKPSDLFSFGIVCLYAVHKRIIFHVGEEELGEGEEALAHVLERQISYFADEYSLAEFFRYIGAGPWAEIFAVVRDGFNAENPRRPIALWQDVSPELKHLVGGLTNFSPDRRLTAHEALDHSWFKDV